eukprot:Nk52_evm50s255 gene=Nk52_evmTU50s255
MSDRKRQEALENLKEAEKLLKTSMFKWKPDHDTAAMYFDKAANNFKVAQCFSEAKAAYIKAAHSHRKCGSLFHAAKDCDLAAQIASKETPPGIKESASLWEESSTLYQEHGARDTAALVLEKASKFLAPYDEQKTVELCMHAADLLISDDKHRQAFDSFKRATNLLLQQKRYGICLRFQEKGWYVINVSFDL